MEPNKDWKRFSKLRIDGKKLSRSAKKAEVITAKHAHKFILRKVSNLRAVRRRISLWLMIVAVLLGTLILQVVWNQTAYHKDGPVAGGIYAEAIEGKIDTLNPLYAKSEAEESARQLLFTSLVSYDDTGRIRNDLASSIKIDATGRLYDVAIRSDAKWSDGQRLSADDVVFTLNLMKNPAARSVMGASWQGVTIEKIDENKVRFKLPVAYAAFQDALTFSILPEHVLRDIEPGMLRENAYSLAPVGSGPFVLTLLQQIGEGDNEHQIAHMAANTNYFRRPIKLDRFELHAYARSEGMVRAAKTHDVNAIVRTTNRDLMHNELPSDFSVKRTAVNNGVYAFFNTESEFLKEVKLRTALWQSVDAAKLRRSLDPHVKQLYLPFIASQIGEPDTLSYAPAFDRAAAGKVLDELGWKLGSDGIRTKDAVKLELRVAVNKTARHEALLEELGKQWQTVGVKVTPYIFEQQSDGESFAQSVLRPRDYDVLINEVAIGANPDVFAYWHSSQASALGLNFSNYKNKVADEILVSARQRSELALRAEKYKSFAKRWSADAPAIPLYQSVIRYAYTNRTTSFDEKSVLPTTSSRYTNITQWTAEQGTVYKTP